MNMPPDSAAVYLTGKFDQLTAALTAGDDSSADKVVESLRRDGFPVVADTVRQYLEAYTALRVAATATVKDKEAVVDAVLRLERLGAVGVTHAMLSAAAAASGS